MALILAGGQGIRKTSSIAAIVPDRSFFTEISFSDKDDDTARKLTGSQEDPSAGFNREVATVYEQTISELQPDKDLDNESSACIDKQPR